MNAPLDRRRAVRPPSAAPEEGAQVYLLPGEWWFGSRVRSVSTLLGSCVAITLWHPRWRLGGMCHFLLPKRHRPPNAPLDGRFGDEAVELLLQAAGTQGIRLPEFEVRLYGGAHMFAGNASATLDIGARNVAHGRALLRRHGLAPLTVEGGGYVHRTILLDFSTGAVHVRTGAASPATLDLGLSGRLER